MTDDLLTGFHSSVAAPEDRLTELVESVMNAQVTDLKRITQGYVNEVYRADFASVPAVFVRIRRRGGAAFSSEAWALRECHRAGVPVPKVYAVTTLEFEQPLEVMILASVPGRPLGEVWPELDETAQAQVIGSVGKVLKRMHGTQTSGWGKRVGDGWEYASWKDRATGMVRERAADVPVLRGAGLTEAETDALMEVVRVIPTLSAPRPVLCHGDLGMDHVFVDDALNVTGVIDFGMWQGGPRELDFAVMSMYHPDVRLGWLEPSFDEGCYRRVLTEKTAVMMGFLAHDLRQGNADYADLAVQGLRDTLAAWQQLTSSAGV